VDAPGKQRGAGETAAITGKATKAPATGCQSRKTDDPCRQPDEYPSCKVESASGLNAIRSMIENRPRLFPGSFRANNLLKHHT
jgi:hypothetical protein